MVGGLGGGGRLAKEAEKEAQSIRRPRGKNRGCVPRCVCVKRGVISSRTYQLFLPVGPLPPSRGGW